MENEKYLHAVEVTATPETTKMGSRLFLCPQPSLHLYKTIIFEIKDLGVRREEQEENHSLKKLSVYASIASRQQLMLGVEAKMESCWQVVATKCNSYCTFCTWTIHRQCLGDATRIIIVGLLSLSEFPSNRRRRDPDSSEAQQTQHQTI